MAGFEEHRGAFQGYGQPAMRARTPMQALAAGIGQAADQYKYDAAGLALALNPATMGASAGTSLLSRAAGFLVPDIASHYLGKIYGEDAEKVADAVTNVTGGRIKRAFSYAWDHMVDPNYSAYANQLITPVQASTKSNKRY